MKTILITSLFILANNVFSQTESEKLLREANDSFNAANFSAALNLYEQSIQADKKNIEAVFWRGRTKIELKDFEGAKKDFGRVLKSMPDHYGALVNRGNVHSLLEDYQSALEDYNKAEEINNADPSVFQNRGKTYFMMQRFDLAIADYTRAIALDPNDKLLFHKRAECYNYAGKTDLAQKDLESVLKIDSTDIEARTNLAFCYILSKRFGDANTLYMQLFKTENTNPYILSNFGYVKHALGNSEEGLRLISKSLEIMPKNSYAYKYLAEIYLQQNDMKKACEAINTGLSLGFTNSYGNELEDLKRLNCK